MIVMILKGLDYAHKNNIIHGNLRPTNILFSREDHVKVTDFGLSPHYEEMDAKNWFSPPEKSISKQADIYALRVILYQLLTGENPIFDPEKNLVLGDLMWTNLEAVNQILAKLLAFRTTERYHLIGEFLEDWKDFRTGLSETLQKPTSPDPQKTDTNGLWKGIASKIKGLMN